jgi:hypothetical protein
MEWIFHRHNMMSTCCKQPLTWTRPCIRQTEPGGVRMDTVLSVSMVILGTTSTSEYIPLYFHSTNTLQISIFIARWATQGRISTMLGNSLLQLLYSGSSEYNSRSTAASSWKNREGWEAFCHIWIASYKSQLRHLLRSDKWMICGISLIPDRKKETSALYLSFHILHRN